ncbi:hypothetical protein ACFOOL_06830 [Devosia honganensis]|uniref:Uncharacterized protein n=1 Tax=Devosia honganensis TaxID=1610527 RepID=A0ABV7X133_9HYPH
MRTVSPTTAGLLAGADQHGIVVSDLVVLAVKEWTGEAATYAFWTEHDTETITVTSPWTGSSQSYPFVGAGAILDVGETSRTSDLSIRRKSITLSNIHPTVMEMWGKDMRLAQVAVFQAIYDPATRNLIDALLEFVGELNGAPKEVPAAGGEGGIKFDFVSDTRQLTRTNPAKRSDAHQRTRSNDGFHKYIGVAGDWIIPFGQESA